jgi:hypothetical protein
MKGESPFIGYGRISTELETDSAFPKPMQLLFSEPQND